MDYDRIHRCYSKRNGSVSTDVTIHVPAEWTFPDGYGNKTDSVVVLNVSASFNTIQGFNRTLFSYFTIGIEKENYWGDFISSLSKYSSLIVVIIVTAIFATLKPAIRRIDTFWSKTKDQMSFFPLIAENKISRFFTFELKKKDLLQIDATVIAGVLILVTLSSQIYRISQEYLLGYTINIVYPFAISAVTAYFFENKGIGTRLMISGFVSIMVVLIILEINLFQNP